MAQLVEQLLLIPEVHSLNPVICKIYIEHLVTAQPKWKDKNKEKRGRECFIFLKKTFLYGKIANVWTAPFVVQTKV